MDPTLLFAYLGVLISVVAPVLVPLFAGRWLAERQDALELREVRAIEDRALALLAGDPQAGS